MFLAFFTNNSLLGEIPEAIGLLLFGISLIAITVGLRWFLDMKEKETDLEENLEKIAGSRDK